MLEQISWFLLSRFPLVFFFWSSLLTVIVDFFWTIIFWRFFGFEMLRLWIFLMISLWKNSIHSRFCCKIDKIGEVFKTLLTRQKHVLAFLCKFPAMLVLILKLWSSDLHLLALVFCLCIFSKTMLMFLLYLLMQVSWSKMLSHAFLMLQELHKRTTSLKSV